MYRHTFILSNDEKQKILKTVEKLLTDNQVERTIMVLTNQRPESEFICRWYCIQFQYTPQHLVRLLPIVVNGNCFKFKAPAAALEIDRLRIRILGLKLQGSTRPALRLRPPTDNQKPGFGSA
ncbi:hypothetical protein M8C21_005012 [Ambrosia artemisiifolia]|uniref:Uncharacterized protein n=1 Tax=Ambrosia artemisiifolia TaxID=4212 RepID=A0AAD5G5M5_AMBAR|nr:hypothetical protein M8C21_005012 [Ambrosia artemisiifolia]